MSHYRKIDTRILLDQKFNQLSSDARLAFIHLLIHPNLTSLGAMHASFAGIACELDWTVERLRDAIESVHQKGMIRYDEQARLIWFPNFLKYNLPESPNVIKSWETALSYLPECELQKQLILHVKQYVSGLSVAFQGALPNCFHIVTASDVSEFHTTPPRVSEAIDDSSLSVHEGSNPNEIMLSEGFLKTQLPLSEGFLKNDIPLPESLSIKHKALNNKHKTVSIKQDEIVLENNSEEKNNIGEIKNIVAPTRQKIAKPPDAEVIDVFRCWQRTLGHPQAQLDAKRRKMIRRAFASGYNVTQLFEAIKGCSQTPHNMGENEQGQRYDGLHIIFRDADQIDRFIRNASSPPQRRTKADQLIADNVAAGDRWLAKKQQQAEKAINAIH